jgi:hypothetical protein
LPVGVTIDGIRKQFTEAGAAYIGWRKLGFMIVKASASIVHVPGWDVD